MTKGIGIYKKTSLRTASKEKILLMLYETAIKSCKKSIEAIKNNNLSEKGPQIAKLQDIIVELNNSLDHQLGGKIANDLSALYDYILFASTKANIDMNIRPLQSCLEILTTLNSGWKKAIETVKNERVKPT